MAEIIKFLRKRREARNDYRQIHQGFRHSYTPSQVRFLSALNLIMFVYALLFLLFSKNVYNDEKNAYIVYGMLAATSAILFGTGVLIDRIKVFKSDNTYELFHEFFTVFCAVMYVIWGLEVVWFSISDGHLANYLPVLIIFAVCSCFLYFNIYHYMILFVIALVGSQLATVPQNYVVDKSIYVNIVVMGFILTLAGVVKYRVSRNRYIAAIQAKKYRTALENSNTELQETNKNLLEVTEKLRKINEAQRLFTASMSHELRSPLNGVIGLLQVLEEDENLQGDSHESIEKALASSKTLIGIVNDLLDYYKLEAGEFNIVSENYDLRSIMQIIYNLFHDQAMAKDLYFNYVVQDNMPCILRGDGLRVQQVITNVVSNAVKYTVTGGITVELAHKDGNLIVKITDTGIGIEKESVDILFDPFKRADEQRNKAIQGTGLGLSIVKKLTEQMGGNILLESEYGKGSEFTICLPAPVMDEKVVYQDSISRKKIEKQSVDYSSLRFLCVDDNRVNLAVFKGLFKGTGSAITTVETGAACLEKIKEEKFDIIFLDHMMPGMDGLETFEKMKEMEHLNKDTPVVMLTANAGDEAEHMYRELGFCGYLSKPILREGLYAIVNEMIGK